MTPERLMSLIEAYGAEPARWPREWRAEAETLLLRGDVAIVNALAQARSLDAELSRYWIEPPDAELVRHITASAPVPPWWRQIGLRTRWWLSGVILVGAGLGGVAAGALAISLIMPVSTVAAGSSIRGSSVGTVFGDVGVDGAEQ